MAERQCQRPISQRAGAGTGHLSRLTKNPLQYSRFVLLQQLHLLMATFHMFERFSKQGVKGWCSQSYVIVKLSASGEPGALMLLLLNLTLCGIILSERGYVLNYHSPVFEIDGALGARRTYFRRYAHIFPTCVPDVHTIFTQLSLLYTRKVHRKSPGCTV